MALLKYCSRCNGLKPPDHRHRAKDKRPSARARGYDHRWAKTRKQFLSRFPICQWHEGCIKQATQVHHLDGQGPLSERGHDWGNLMALCASHHAQITAEAQPGGWNKR